MERGNDGVRDRLIERENAYIDSRSLDMAEEIKQMREELNGLKDDYILLVGAEDLPLYFGRSHQ